MEVVLKFITDILSEPATLIALFTGVGYILLRKPVEKIISGTIKSFVGFLILGAGATVVVGALTNFSSVFEVAFGFQGVIPNNEAIVSIALVQYGAVTSLIMIFGMIMNLIFARFTPLKYVFLTGHHTLFMACLIGVVMISCGIPTVYTVILGSILLGFLMVLMPAIAQPFMRKITGTNDVAMGHFGTISYVIAALAGKVFSKKSKEQSTENFNIPQRLSFLRDTTVALAITMVILFVIVSAFAGGSYIEAELSDGKS